MLYTSLRLKIPVTFGCSLPAKITGTTQTSLFSGMIDIFSITVSKVSYYRFTRRVRSIPSILPKSSLTVLYFKLGQKSFFCGSSIETPLSLRPVAGVYATFNFVFSRNSIPRAEVMKG
jgi:hypothetical protein